MNRQPMNPVMHPTINKSARRAGFTLIELLIVVALISIMLVIAVPSFTSFISNYRVTSAMNDFLQGVTLTRTEAIKRSRRVLMVPNDSSGAPSIAGEWKYGWTVFVDANSNNAYDVPPLGPPPPPPAPPFDTLIFQHDSLPVSIVVTDASGGPAKPFTDGSSRTYVSFDGSGYPRQLPPSAVLTGGIVFTDTTGSSVTKRTMCLATLGRSRIVKGLDPCTSG